MGWLLQIKWFYCQFCFTSRCNGLVDCNDASDEKYCSQSGSHNTTTQSPHDPDDDDDSEWYEFNLSSSRWESILGLTIIVIVGIVLIVSITVLSIRCCCPGLGLEAEGYNPKYYDRQFSRDSAARWSRSNAYIEEILGSVHDLTLDDNTSVILANGGPPSRPISFIDSNPRIYYGDLDNLTNLDKFEEERRRRRMMNGGENISLVRMNGGDPVGLARAHSLGRNAVRPQVKIKERPEEYHPGLARAHSLGRATAQAMGRGRGRVREAIPPTWTTTENRSSIRQFWISDNYDLYSNESQRSYPHPLYPEPGKKRHSTPEIFHTSRA